MSEEMQRKLERLQHQYKAHIAYAERLESWAKGEPERTLQKARDEREKAQWVAEHMALLEEKDG